MRGDPGPLRLDEKTLKDNLGLPWKDRDGRIRTEKTIFVGSSTDMWAQPVRKDDIIQVLLHCSKYPENVYVFQSKNPCRFYEFYDFLPPRKLMGTTIESDMDMGVSFNPCPRVTQRFACIAVWRRHFISIEPILDFNLIPFVDWFKRVQPVFVSIGADSQKHNLPEPSAEKVKALIEELKKFTEVKLKDNLNRILTA